MSKHIKLYTFKLCSFVCQLYLNKLILKNNSIEWLKSVVVLYVLLWKYPAFILLSDKVERHNNMYIVAQNSIYFYSTSIYEKASDQL